jgi:glutathione S-transferase
MSDLILHHYPNSPFSEKIRLIFGYKQLTWKSVVIPAIMPKPDVLALTGGYRKTPFLQIGSDVYCDSALICDVLEQLHPTPTLYPQPSQGVARVLAQWADTTLFWAAMAYNLQPKGAAAMFAGAPPEAAKAFGTDRAAMTTGMNRLRPGDATAAYKSYLRRMANMLEGQDFLLGSAPCVADFAAYHPLWFTQKRVPVMAGILDATPTVLAWMERMAALSHGAMEKYSATESIAACEHSTGAAVLNDAVFQDEHGIPLGSRVTVAADTFGLEATEGELVAATRTRYTLRRVDARAGLVHVHFPRIGYVLKKAEA